MVGKIYLIKIFASWAFMLNLILVHELTPQKKQYYSSQNSIENFF